MPVRKFTFSICKLAAGLQVVGTGFHCIVERLSEQHMYLFHKISNSAYCDGNTSVYYTLESPSETIGVLSVS